MNSTMYVRYLCLQIVFKLIMVYALHVLMVIDYTRVYASEMYNFVLFGISAHFNALAVVLVIT